MYLLFTHRKIAAIICILLEDAPFVNRPITPVVDSGRMITTATGANVIRYANLYLLDNTPLRGLCACIRRAPCTSRETEEKEHSLQYTRQIRLELNRKSWYIL